MGSVGFATLITQPTKVNGLGNVSDLWLGDALTEAGDDVRMYIKHPECDAEFVSEFISAVVGIELGLPIPRAYLVRDQNFYTGHDILIGSEDADMPSFKHLVTLNNADVLEEIKKWGQMYEAAAFDEWIANPDRNQGNLLWDGDKEWQLIDHARALSSYPVGKPWAPRDPVIPNILASTVKQLYSNLGVIGMEQKSKSQTDNISGIDENVILSAARCTAIGQDSRCREALQFLTERVQFLPKILADYKV